MKIPVSAAFPLVTERLLIREFVPEDRVRMRDFALDPLFWLHTSLSIMSVSDLDAFVRDLVAQQSDEDRQVYTLAVNRREDGALIGFVKVGVESGQDQVGMLGYAIGGQYAGCGYATEAAAAMLPFAFVALGYRRLVASSDITNPASVHILEKLGFTREGHLRQHRLVSGEATDSLIYGLLAEEFLSGSGP